MRSRASSRLGIRERLQGGFEAGAVEVHYQPLIDTGSGAPVGLEALARWRHPDLGLLRPGEFLELAEEMGLAAALDHRVLERVAEDRQGWRATAPHLLDLPIGVNITVADVGPTLEDHIARFFDSPGGAGTELFLDLTERALLLNVDAVAATLERLAERGVGIVLDDFGVGYSSLAHLHRMPIGHVKLDRAFLASAQTTGAGFMGAVVNLCTSLGLGVIAEGIETYEQHELIRSVGIRRAQGFLYAEPRGARAIGELLAGEPLRSAHPAPPEQGASRSGAVGPSR
jgi:EAL domain-containing protein (putative c-di-GMP-specific phosphodiesterase class I)